MEDTTDWKDGDQEGERGRYGEGKSGLDEEKGSEKEEKELGSQDKFLQC